MHTKTHTAQTVQTAQPLNQRQSLLTLSRHAKVAIRLIVVGAVFLGIGFTGWNMLRAEFDESFNGFSSCQTVALERSA